MEKNTQISTTTPFSAEELLTRILGLAACVAGDTLPLRQMRVVLVEQVFDAPLVCQRGLQFRGSLSPSQIHLSGAARHSHTWRSSVMGEVTRTRLTKHPAANVACSTTSVSDLLCMTKPRNSNGSVRTLRCMTELPMRVDGVKYQHDDSPPSPSCSPSADLTAVGTVGFGGGAFWCAWAIFAAEGVVREDRKLRSIYGVGKIGSVDSGLD